MDTSLPHSRFLGHHATLLRDNPMWETIWTHTQNWLVAAPILGVKSSLFTALLRFSGLSPHHILIEIKLSFNV